MPSEVASEESGIRVSRWIGLAGGVVLAGILLVFPPPDGITVEGWRTAAVGILMAIWWMTEAIPIPATALLPLVLFPVLDIAGIRAAAAPYANPLIFLFFGGFVIAIAMERWELHRRLALSIIDYVGVRPKRIVTGFAIAAAFLSMWVSNTATAMMMLPIGLSVVDLVRRNDEVSGENFATNLMLVIAYACSIGGMATLIGTPPNALFAGFMLESYDRSIGFVEWMMLGVPLVLVALPLMIVVLTRVIYPIHVRTIPGGRDYIRESRAGLGKMERGEKLVAVVFATTAILWMTRPLLEPVIPGLSDAGIAVAMAVLLFILPVDIQRGEFVITWEDAERMPWGVLVLFGGGLSLAAAIDQTGLAAWLGTQTAALGGLHPLVIILAITTTIVMLTELTSNTATSAAFIPIAASVAVGLGLDPLVLGIPATLAASAAFMLPVATPPNAIVYGSGMVSIPRMARGGVALNLIFILLISVGSYFFVPLLFVG